MICLIGILGFLLVCFILFIVVYGYGSFREFLYFMDSSWDDLGYVNTRTCILCGCRQAVVIHNHTKGYWEVLDKGRREDCGCLRFIGKEKVIL